MYSTPKDPEDHGKGMHRAVEGVFSIDFHREANSLEEAIRSAITNVKSAGYEVERVEIEAEAVTL